MKKEMMMLHTMRDTRVKKKNTIVTSMKRKLSEHHDEALRTNKLVKGSITSDSDQEMWCPESSDGGISKPGLYGSVSALGLVDSWEVDSGFSSEASPPASGRSTPCLSLGSTTVVALDCEMVGTGPGGRCSELARCSILDYHGNMLYNKFVQPCQPVTDYRTPWSGIQRHHLRHAISFTQAREEVITILKGKVVVGHSVYNDFEVLDIIHPGHMVRDTSMCPLLGRLAGFPRKRCPSLKILASKLLNRKIQRGRRGHSSVEDAQAALDLYKLVEGEWEHELQTTLRDDDSPVEPSYASSSHYMNDQYWPDDVIGGRQ